jgi:hypothetical protein
MDLVASVCQPSTLRMLICPEASKAQNSIAALSDGSTALRRLDSSLELLAELLDCIRGAHAAPLANLMGRAG